MMIVMILYVTKLSKKVFIIIFIHHLFPIAHNKNLITGVAETTIKQTYKFMLPRVAELFPDDFKFAVPIDSLPAS